jgi:glycosyltransferase involved in cell wall biosynthesis
MQSRPRLTKKPKYTIAIPVHNRLEYLKQAIRSSLAQTVSDFEVVISDDCSTDDLGSIVNSFNDPRIFYHRSEQRLGAARNHQLSVALSHGDYIVNLHSDDLLFPTYLEVAGHALDTCGEGAAVYSSMACLSGSKITGWNSVPKIRFANREVYLENPWLEKFHNTAPSCCLFRSSAFQRIGGYGVSVRSAYDWELFMRFMNIGGGVLFLPDILSVYRIHEGQATQTVSVQGLYDILDLWQLKQYAHWPSSDIADLVLTALSIAVRSGSDWVDIIEQIRRSGLALRVLRGLPRAVVNKALRKVRLSARRDNNYESPADLESALRTAGALIGN